jgi:hypothetical protein
MECSGLTIADLGEGLGEIGEEEFYQCTSLCEIVIPPAVRVIHEEAFNNCLGLTIVVLGKGLEEIWKWEFCQCTLLHEIVIPPAIRVIHKEAFNECLQLTNVRFCNEIEEFVSGELMRDWWNHGVHEWSLSTYCFLVRCNIPECLDLIRPMKWQATIHKMLRHIPSISTKGLDFYFDSIDSKVFEYRNLVDTPTMLVLAIWKSKIAKQCGPNNDLLTSEVKVQCRSDSVTMVIIIVQNVLAFL